MLFQCYKSILLFGCFLFILQDTHPFKYFLTIRHGFDTVIFMRMSILYNIRLSRNTRTMKKYIAIPPVSHEAYLKISIFKSLMYCGVLWGLYDQGWAITSDQSGNIFPFWFNSIQALQYAKLNWPHYTPRKISPQDFKSSLLPLLLKMNVTPVLYNASSKKFKLSTPQFRSFFFTQSPVLMLT